MSNRKDRTLFYRGRKGKKFGVYNTVKKKFQFGIVEDSPYLAQARLTYLIGDDARKWRFEYREIPPEIYGSPDFIEPRS